MYAECKEILNEYPVSQDSQRVSTVSFEDIKILLHNGWEPESELENFQSVENSRLYRSPISNISSTTKPK